VILTDILELKSVINWHIGYKSTYQRVPA